MTDAIDPLRFARGQGIQQSTAARPASPSPKFGAAAAQQQPQLRTAPPADMFVKSTKAPAESAALVKPTFGNAAGNASQKPGLGAFMQSMKDKLPNLGQLANIGKTSQTNAVTPQNLAAPAPRPQGIKPQFGAVNAFNKAAETMAMANPKLTPSPFNAFNQTLQKQKSGMAALSAALPLFGMATLAGSVVAPAVMVAQPSLLNHIVSSVLPATLP